MNENEIMNNEVTMEEMNVDTCKSAGTGNLGLLAVKAAIGACAGGIALAILKRKAIANWAEQRKVKALEKKGYVVLAKEEVKEVIDTEVCEEESENVEE